MTVIDNTYVFEIPWPIKGHCKGLFNFIKQCLTPNITIGVNVYGIYDDKDRYECNVKNVSDETFKQTVLDFMNDISKGWDLKSECSPTFTNINGFVEGRFYLTKRQPEPLFLPN